MTKTTKRISLILGCFIGCTLLNAGGAQAAGVTAKENLEKLIKTKSCKGCDLSGLNLNRMDLAGVDLEGADLSFSKLFLANLAGANLQNSTLNGVKFGGADLGDADLRGADLRGASLDGAYLGGANLDGEFVSSLPFENLGITDVEKDVYVEDQAKPKKHPENQEVKVGFRRDFEEPPPQLRDATSEPVVAPHVEQPKTEVVEAAPKEMVLPQPPAAKKIKPVSPVVVDDPVRDSIPTKVDQKNGVVVAAIQPVEKVVQEQEITPDKAEPVEQTVVKKDEVAPAPPEETVIAESEEALVDTVETGTPEIGKLNTDLALDKKKRDNLSRLLDKNRCYGCDLSGLDLSGKDFEGADLEKADLTECNLVKADLEEANLKGAKLQNADIRNADLRETDFYKADLTGADLTGSKMKGALFDGATMTGTQGIDSQLMTTQ